MSKYSEQFKLEVIQRYLSGPLGFRAVADEAGVGVALVKRWVAFYRSHGVDGITATRHVRYSAEFKLKVLRHMWDNHLSYAQAAAFFNVRGQCNVVSWHRKYQASGADALMPKSAKMSRKVSNNSHEPPVPVPADAVDGRSREQLVERIEDLEMEVAYLKKLRALIQSQQGQQAPRKKRKS
jgi:transposase